MELERLALASGQYQVGNLTTWQTIPVAPTVTATAAHGLDYSGSNLVLLPPAGAGGRGWVAPQVRIPLGPALPSGPLTTADLSASIDLGQLPPSACNLIPDSGTGDGTGTNGSGDTGALRRGTGTGSGHEA